MCGILAYIGKKPAKESLIQGLKSLEYRGYDSAGLAVLNDSEEIELLKTQGKIVNLEARLEEYASLVKAGASPAPKNSPSAFETSTCGIGHTRWATHGKPSDVNAHPHQDTAAGITLVHNGIIKNAYQLREELEKQGVKFKSETDTEVIAQLFALNRESKPDLEALAETTKKLEGSYALAILVKGSRKLLLAKNQSPLVIGPGQGENYVASDSATVLQFTNKILKLKDKQMAVLTEDAIKVYDDNCEQVGYTIQEAQQTDSLLNKGPYKHFLLKEIHEQPTVIGHMLSEAAFNNLQIDFKKINKISFVACGSAYHAALIGKYLIELWAKLPVDVNIASEYCSFPSLACENELVIGISQSGETADTLAAIRSAQSAGAQIMAITNKVDSAIYDLCSPNTYVTPAGMEVSVASTKAFTSQVLSLYLLAIKIAEEKQGVDLEAVKEELHKLPLIIDQCIERADDYHRQFIKYANYRDFLFLSRGVNYPIALEGALKLKELSYIHATGYPSGEMKHGPIAILDKNVPVLSVAIDGESAVERMVYKKTLSNAEEARARMSPSIVVATDDNQDVEKVFDEVIRIPNISQLFSPIIATIPLQFLAYYIAEELGKDVDQPRNLAKSVTVE